VVSTLQRRNSGNTKNLFDNYTVVVSSDGYSDRLWITSIGTRNHPRVCKAYVVRRESGALAYVF